MTAEGISAELRDWVAATVGGAVTDEARIGSGASRQIWRVTAGGRPFVLRVDTGDGPVAGTPLDLRREAVVYRALQGRGLPVPVLHGVAPDGTALLMDLVEGEEALAGAANVAAVSDDYLRRLGHLHMLPVDDLDLPGFDRPRTPADHALVDLRLWSAISAGVGATWTTPAVRAAMRWLKANAPTGTVVTALCHGDAGPGNFLFVGESVTALLDWEFAHVGDPHDDLAWVAVRNHLLGRPMVLADVFRAWRDVTDQGIDTGRLDYYRVLVLVRMAVSCDASLAWKHGVEDDIIRTQALLRPWLGTAIAAALGFAGADDPSVRKEAEEVLAASPHASLLALIPPLEPFGSYA